MPQFSPRLPSRSELELAGLVVIVLLCALFMNERRKVAVRDAVIAARPMVSEQRHEEKAKDVKRGPSRTTTKTTFDPATGKKLAVEKVKEEGASEEHAASKLDLDHKEVPACPPADRVPTRYVGLALPLDDWKKPRVSAGLTFAGRLDLGAYYDTRYNAAGAESRYRW